MTLNMIASEMRINQQHVQFAYNRALTLRRKLIDAKRSGKDIPYSQLIDELGDIMSELEPTVEETNR